MQVHRGPQLEAHKWFFTTTGSQPMRGRPILGPELTFRKDSVTKVQRKQTAHTVRGGTFFLEFCQYYT